MAARLITYDLTKPGRDYDKLIAAIKRYPGWCPVTESTWLVSTVDTPVEIRDALARVIDTNDKLFVIDVTGKAAAWRGLGKSISEWIQKHV